MRGQLDRVGLIGLFITVITSPCCFPLFSIVLTSFGLGTFELFGGWTMYSFQGMVLMSLTGTYLSYRRHRCMYPVLIALPSAVVIFYAYYISESDHWTTMTYIG